MATACFVTDLQLLSSASARAALTLSCQAAAYLPVTMTYTIFTLPELSVLPMAVTYSAPPSPTHCDLMKCGIILYPQIWELSLFVLPNVHLWYSGNFFSSRHQFRRALTCVSQSM